MSWRGAMTPQDHLIIVAAVADERVADLRALLATMTLAGFPGMADPANAIFPFGQFDTIHFARFVVLFGERSDWKGEVSP